jgi:hypothetical protein
VAFDTPARRAIASTGAAAKPLSTKTSSAAASSSAGRAALRRRTGGGFSGMEIADQLSAKPNITDRLVSSALLMRITFSTMPPFLKGSLRCILNQQ